MRGAASDDTSKYDRPRDVRSSMMRLQYDATTEISVEEAQQRLEGAEETVTQMRRAVHAG